MKSNDFEISLKKHVDGDIHFDAIHRKVYSIDASIYEIEPMGIVLPRNKEALQTAIEIAEEFQVPIIPRGAATGITGGCLGSGLVIDTSKYLNKIIEVDYEAKYAICEPGVIQDQLNDYLFQKGFRLGPDTSTGNRATLGGMLANNAAGSRSLFFGTMADHTSEAELILASGKIVRFATLNDVQFSEKCTLDNEEGHIYRTLRDIQSEYGKDVLRSFPKLPRRVSGYNLDMLLQSPINMCRLIAGSEGTLGVISELKVNICPILGRTNLCLIYFANLYEAMWAVEYILSFNPVALELIDRKIMEAGVQAPSMRNKLAWLKDIPEALLIVEFAEKDEEQTLLKLKTFQAEIHAKKIGSHSTILNDQTQINQVWELRKSGLGLLLSKRSYSRAIAFIEDVSVPPQRLVSFTNKFLDYLKKINKEAGFYGHVGAGCLHLRPYIDLRSESEKQLMEQIQLDILKILIDHGGVLSGEHGDGLVRSWLNQKQFGKRLYAAFQQIKDAFDPNNRMNPGKIVNGQQLLENLRDFPKEKIKTFLNFDKEGGFELAVDLCNGNGRCRKPEKLMCPSFQATNDEFHTTRARAQALRSIINGRLPIQDFTSQEMHDVLDLCIQCKGCKTECPSEVDMAKMKSEFLYHFQKEHGTSLRNQLFARIGQFNRIAYPFRALVNPLSDLNLVKSMMNWLGITPKRPLPKLTSQKFSTWFKHHPASQKREKVVLFNDTYNEFHEPEIGKAAVHLLDQMGFEVIVPSWQCCGRPAFSKGHLKLAQKMAKRLCEQLSTYTSKQIPIVGLEPSCLLMIKDDYYGLLSENPVLDSLSSNCYTFAEFIKKNLDRLSNVSWKEGKGNVLLHGHCHQKALVGMQPSLEVLNIIPQIKVREIPSGCCGMAGSFGYEKEHYEISQKIGDLHLFPTILQATGENTIIADGFSCRHQIEQGTKKRSIHLAEYLTSILKY